MRRYRFHTERRNHSWAYTGEEEQLQGIRVRGIVCIMCGEERQVTKPAGLVDRKGCVRETLWSFWQIGDHVAVPFGGGTGTALYIFDGWASLVTARLRGFAGGQRKIHADQLRRP